MTRVNDPKIRLKQEHAVEVNEPERHSMYQILLENLKIANRATYLHRIIYVGEHYFQSCDDAKDVFENIIKKCNETYCIEKLSGFFLYYSKYFVHMVEGDEDNLNKHLGFLLDHHARHFVFLGPVKLLIHVSHINQRFFEDWICYAAVPPMLLEKLDLKVDLHQSGRHIYNCIKKVYGLLGKYSENLQTTSNEPKKLEGDIITVNTMSSGGSAIFYPKSFSSLSYVSPSEFTAGKEYKIYLPEYELLEFVIKTDFTMRLQDYYNVYGVVPMRDIYKDRVWPVPHDFIPYDVFEKPYDCITEFPKETKKQLERVVDSDLEEEDEK
ncbi:uncharacterized protein LOC132702803 isoform X2 [Cylas formicarius]|uniref:uncharacterized protein LOC132702803 isoform X2 n=1 Tax=Cylas formicarius TaxID=197179 RepID=UPI002958CD50|nr:uncharacterized protein LOC132702803 isoform X2 [Cylas formicarius]